MSFNNFALSLDIPEPNGSSEPPLGNAAFLPLSLDLNLACSEDPSVAVNHDPVDHCTRELEAIKKEFEGMKEEEDADHGDDHINSQTSYPNATCFERIEHNEPPKLSFNFSQGTLTLEVPEFGC
ncbi:unnamed protein product [Auanema sp. JU1783]|nr:unnamed protein product [Auanema sp. JU1783]